MPKTESTLGQINQTVRTILMVAVVGGVGFGSYKGYQAYIEPQRKLKDVQDELTTTQGKLEKAELTITEQSQKVKQLGEQVAERDAQIDELQLAVDRMETSIKLLKLRHRIARFEVLEQTIDEEKNVTTRIKFYEIGEDGQTLGEPVEFTLNGDRVYVEYLVVKFDDKYVEEAELERGTAICLFERVFSENQEPEKGFVIDRVGSRPTAYQRGSETSEFEQKIWDDFWTIAGDRERARELGIRASHAQAPSVRVQEGKTYELDLRSTGEFTLGPIDD